MTTFLNNRMLCIYFCTSPPLGALLAILRNMNIFLASILVENYNLQNSSELKPMGFISEQEIYKIFQICIQEFQQYIVRNKKLYGYTFLDMVIYATEHV